MHRKLLFLSLFIYSLANAPEEQFRRGSEAVVIFTAFIVSMPFWFSHAHRNNIALFTFSDSQANAPEDQIRRRSDAVLIFTAFKVSM